MGRTLREMGVTVCKHLRVAVTPELGPPRLMESGGSAESDRQEVALPTYLRVCVFCRATWDDDAKCWVGGSPDAVPMEGYAYGGRGDLAEQDRNPVGA